MVEVKKETVVTVDSQRDKGFVVVGDVIGGDYVGKKGKRSMSRENIQN